MRHAVSAATILVTVLFASPVLVAAQASQEDLREAIQASVLSDPRVSEIPPSQLAGLVDALVQQAQAQNMAASDILWQPRRAEAATLGGSGAAEDVACPEGIQGYLCQFNRVFGFEGDSYDIPIFVLVTSGLLIAVIWELIAHHRKKMAKMAAKSKVAS